MFWVVPWLRSARGEDDVEDGLENKDDNSDDPDNVPLVGVSDVVIDDLTCDAGSHEAWDGANTVGEAQDCAREVWSNVLRVGDPGRVESSHAAHANSEHDQGEGEAEIRVGHEQDDHEKTGSWTNMSQSVGHLPHYHRPQHLPPDQLVRGEGDDDAEHPHGGVGDGGPETLLAAGVHVVREHLTQVLRQLCHQEVESPVVSEVCHQDCPEWH